MTFAVIDMQGFQVGRCFTPKELALTKDGDVIQHFNLESFTPYHILSQDEKLQIRYLQFNHHGIHYSAPGLPPSYLVTILNNFIAKNNITEIYVKGHQKKIFLEKLMSTPVINVEYESECPKFTKSVHPLCDSECHSMTSDVVCASKNCRDLYNWLREFF